MESNPYQASGDEPSATRAATSIFPKIAVFSILLFVVSGLSIVLVPFCFGFFDLPAEWWEPAFEVLMGLLAVLGMSFLLALVGIAGWIWQARRA